MTAARSARFRGPAWGSVISLLGTVAAHTAFGFQQTPTFRSSIEIVTVHATVRDRNGRLVPLLPQSEFELTVDNKPVAIASFANEARPITAAVMIDTSESMVPRLTWSRNAALGFVNALRDNDRVRIGSFGWEVVVSPHLTGDKAITRRVLTEELWPGGPTWLWNALQTAIASIETEDGRRAVLTISDGGGSPLGSEVELTPRILDRALASGVIVYAIGGESRGLGLFKEIAEKTGGGYVSRPDVVDTDALMRQVADELRHEYLIGFVPLVQDGREHTLAIRTKTAGLRTVFPPKFVAPSRRQ